MDTWDNVQRFRKAEKKFITDMIEKNIKTFGVYNLIGIGIAATMIF